MLVYVPERCGKWGLSEKAWLLEFECSEKIRGAQRAVKLDMIETRKIYYELQILTLRLSKKAWHERGQVVDVGLPPMAPDRV